MALDCNAAAASEAVYPLEFISSRGTNIPLGSYSSGVCYTQTTLPGTTETIMKPILTTPSLLGGLIPSFTIKVPVTINKPGETVTNSNGWALSPFNVEAKGSIKIWWKENGHLMVTVTDVYSTVTGTDGDTGQVFQAPLYSGNVGWALYAAVSDGTPQGVPSDNDPNWRFCLGGWWSAPMAGCGTSCPDRWGNPGGGTMYNWNKWTGEDAKFVQNGNTPGRRDQNIEWDLGEVQPADGLGIFLYARGVRGARGSQHFDPKMGARQALAFAVPMPAICPPEITGVEMTRDICEEKVAADVKISVPALGGNTTANLILEYAPNSTFAGSTIIQKTVTASSNISIRLDNLFPNTRYCFRAQLATSKVASDWSETLCDTTLFFPRAEWVVPVLTEEECEAMTAGDCIPEFTEDTPGLEQCKGAN